MMGTRRPIKIVLISMVVVILALLSVLVKNFAQHRGKGRIDIQVAPTDSLVQINGKRIRGSKQYLSPGTYKVEASKSGFTNDAQTIQLEKNQVRTAYLSPEPNSAEAQAWLTSHPKEQAKREAIGGQKFKIDQDYIHSHYPLLAKLPQEFRYFSLSYGQSTQYPNDPKKIAIIIKAFDASGRQQALQWIRSQGYDPTNYLIEFSGFYNPFIGEPGI